MASAENEPRPVKFSFECLSDDGNTRVWMHLDGDGKFEGSIYSEWPEDDDVCCDCDRVSGTYSTKYTADGSTHRLVVPPNGCMPEFVYLIKVRGNAISFTGVSYFSGNRDFVIKRGVMTPG
jgi:hypothetical protein